MRKSNLCFVVFFTLLLFSTIALPVRVVSRTLYADRLCSRKSSSYHAEHFDALPATIHAEGFHQNLAIMQFIHLFWILDTQWCANRLLDSGNLLHLLDSWLFAYVAVTLWRCSTKSGTSLPGNTAGPCRWALLGNNHGGLSQWGECLGISYRSTWPPKQ